MLSTGCQWGALPKDLPPKSTAHDYFILLDRSGALASMHEALYVAVREAAGREASPSTGIICEIAWKRNLAFAHVESLIQNEKRL